MPAESRIAIRVKPGAGRTTVGGEYGAPASGSGGGDGNGRGSASGTGRLVVAVKERAVDGKATAAALTALAKALGVPPRTVRLVAGAAARDKIVAIEDPPPDLAARIEALRAAR
jgi:uncharacterized protein